MMASGRLMRGVQAILLFNETSIAAPLSDVKYLDFQ
jgi:hypothetical protein